MICKTCFKVHGRDTSQPIECPFCHNAIGCFWHMGDIQKHINQCKSNPHRRLYPTVEEIEEQKKLAKQYHIEQ